MQLPYTAFSEGEMLVDAKNRTLPFLISRPANPPSKWAQHQGIANYLLAVHSVAMAAPCWGCHGWTICWGCRGCTMLGLPWLHHAWGCHGCTMLGLPWLHHAGVAMAAPCWGCHGCTMLGLPWLHHAGHTPCRLFHNNCVLLFLPQPLNQRPTNFLPPWSGPPPPVSPECEQDGLLRCGTIICTIISLLPLPEPPTEVTVFARLYVSGGGACVGVVNVRTVNME